MVSEAILKPSFFSRKKCLYLYAYISQFYYTYQQVMPDNVEDRERLLMIKNQIESRGIRDEKLISVLYKVPRHLFVPLPYKDLAYTDQALPSYSGQTISQPYIVAKMTQLLSLDKNKKVLEIGTGTGYQTAILAELAKEVYTMEIIPELYQIAKSNPFMRQYTNIHFILGNGYKGYETAAPFDAIIVTAAPPTLPQILVEQLAKGGKMVIPVGSLFQMLYLMEKDMKNKTTQTEIFPVVFVPMKR